MQKNYNLFNVFINFACMEYFNKIYNIIVAAGSGNRFGSPLPKQYCFLDGKPVVMHAIERMRNALPNSNIILVINKSYHELWLDLCLKHDFISPNIVYGGDTRWQSVKNAIETIPNDAEIITIHDGARPLIDKDMITRIITGCKNSSGAIPVIPVTDSLRQVTDNGTSIPVDRSKYFAVQTPQAFDAKKLINAYNLPYYDTFTDDASVMKAAGHEDVSLVEGSIYNLKITNPLDLEIANIYINH